MAEERIDTLSPTESIPPSQLIDRVLERSDRTMRDGFMMLREEMAATRRWVTGVIMLAMILLGARDFGKFVLESSILRIETSHVQTNSTIGSTP